MYIIGMNKAEMIQEYLKDRPEIIRRAHAKLGNQGIMKKVRRFNIHHPGKFVTLKDIQSVTIGQNRYFSVLGMRWEKDINDFNASVSSFVIVPEPKSGKNLYFKFSATGYTADLSNPDEVLSFGPHFIGRYQERYSGPGNLTGLDYNQVFSVFARNNHTFMIFHDPRDKSNVYLRVTDGLCLGRIDSETGIYRIKTFVDNTMLFQGQVDTYGDIEEVSNIMDNLFELNMFDSTIVEEVLERLGEDL